MKTTFLKSDNKLSISFNVIIPLKDGKPAYCQTRDEYYIEVISKYRNILIGTLERRMQACQNNLLRHLDDIVFNNGDEIGYKRADGSMHSFNTPSFVLMQEGVESLKRNEFKSVIRNHALIEQIIKAICNDGEKLDKSDRGLVKFSDLVSVLLELLQIEL